MCGIKKWLATYYKPASTVIDSDAGYVWNETLKAQLNTIFCAQQYSDC